MEEKRTETRKLKPENSHFRTEEDMYTPSSTLFLSNTGEMSAVNSEKFKGGLQRWIFIMPVLAPKLVEQFSTTQIFLTDFLERLEPGGGVRWKI